MTTQTIQTLDSRERLGRRLTIAAVALLASYLYLSSDTVFNLVARQQLLDNLSRRQTAVVSLETDYLSRYNSLTLDLAHQLGFQDAASDTTFAPSLLAAVSR